jgi:hypothetical protein
MPTLLVDSGSELKSVMRSLFSIFLANMRAYKNKNCGKFIAQDFLYNIRYKPKFSSKNETKQFSVDNNLLEKIIISK